jgi:hypothetical protein
MADDPGPDWRLLAPHRPLSPGDGAYVARPTNGGDAIAAWVVAGGGTVLVSGPAGVGKSTELAQAALALQAKRVACLVQVDRMANMHDLGPDILMRIIAMRLVTVARDHLKLPISQDLLVSAIPPSEEDRAAHPDYVRNSGMALVRAAVAEVARVSRQRRVALLVDGLEKLSPGPDTREVLDALSQLPESIDLVMVIPWHAAFAGGIEPILRAGEHLHRVAALETDGAAGLATARFLDLVLARRLLNADTVPAALEPLLGLAFKSSGGIPRVFLQLMADAGTYARVNRAAPWPNDSDLREAIADQQDSFRRALLPGDTDAIKAVAGTDGRELDFERRIRLMAQGILLERIRDRTVVVEVHPLAVPAIGNSGP